MKDLPNSLGLLLGVLLAAAGLVALLLSGLDPLYGGCGLALALLGGILVKSLRGKNGVSAAAGRDGPLRSTQLPPEAEKKRETPKGRL